MKLLYFLLFSSLIFIVNAGVGTTYGCSTGCSASGNYLVLASPGAASANGAFNMICMETHPGTSLPDTGTGVCSVYDDVRGGGRYYEPPPISNPAIGCGSVIRFDNYSVAESVPVVGTEETLNYSSDRTPRPSTYSIELPMTSNPVDGLVDSVTAAVSIAGQYHFIRYRSLSNSMNHSFTWDGKDANGNWMPGAALATIKLHQIYGSVSFKDFPIEYRYVLGRFNALRAIGLGGWTLSSNHYYDLVAKLVHYGSGDMRNVEAQSVKMTGAGKVSIVSSGPFDYYMVANRELNEAYFFNLTGRHIQTRSTLTGALLKSFSYDGSGNLTAITDGYNNTTRITRSTSSTTLITAPFGQVTTLTLDGSSRITNIEDPMGHDHAITYNAAGLMETFEQPSGAINTFTYDADGKLTRDEHSAGASTDLTFTKTVPANMSLGPLFDLDVTTAEGVTTNIQSQPVIPLGQGYGGHTIYEPWGGIKTYLYHYVSHIYNLNDGLVYDISNTISADSRLGDSAQYISSRNMTNGSQSATVTKSHSPSYSGSDLLVLTSDSESTTKYSKTWTRAYSNSTKTNTFTSPEGLVRTVQYNNQNQITQTQDYGYAPVVYAYDSRGRVDTITQSGRVWDIDYNGNGFVQSIENPEGKTTSFTYNDNGKVETQTLPDTRVLTYDYDDNGNLNSIETAASVVHGIVSNLYDLIDTYVAPMLGMSTYNTSYAYNDDKKIELITRPSTDTIGFTYNGTTGLLSTITTGAGNFGFTYHSSKDLVDNITSPQSVTNYFTWDGRLPLSFRTAWGSISAKNTYTYSNFRIATSKVTDDSNTDSSVSLGYDDDDLLTSIGDLTISRNSTTGQVDQTTIGNVDEYFTYDSTYGELDSYEAKYSGSSIYKEEYTTRNGLGQITQKVVTTPGPTVVTYDYEYDDVGRLHKVYVNTTLTRTYNYDDNNNRDSLVDGGGTTSGTFNAQDWMTAYGIYSFAHNDNGERTQRTQSGSSLQFDYTYDVFGHLTQVSHTYPSGMSTATDTYDYLNDAVGNRIQVKKNSTFQHAYLYDEKGRVVAELDSSGNLVSHFIYGTMEHSPDYMIQGSTKYKFIHDQVGSVKMVVNTSTGAVASSLEYDEFGNITSSSSPDFQPFGFAGGLKDSVSGLVRFGARDYDPLTGRWLSKDPILFKGGDTNLYGYVVSDPINFIDSQGLWSLFVGYGAGYYRENNPGSGSGSSASHFSGIGYDSSGGGFSFHTSGNGSGANGLFGGGGIGFGFFTGSLNQFFGGGTSSSAAVGWGTEGAGTTYFESDSGGWGLQFDFFGFGGGAGAGRQRTCTTPGL